ncbi:hypothetical protein D3C76_901250 [compost metagenome]
MDRALHQQARVGRADFALVEEDAERGFLGRQVQVLAIGEHQVRALAAAFQPHLLEVRLRGVLHEVLADLGGAGKHQGIDVHVQAQGATGLFTQTRHDVEHALGNARFNRQLGQAQRRERRLLGGLEHHAIARSQCRGELPGGHVQREIPRHHRTDHPQRHPGDGRQGIAGGRRHLVVELVEAFAVPGKHMGGARHVDVPGIRHRLAHAQRVEQGQLVTVLQHQLRQAQQHGLALGRCALRPGALLERLASTAHGLVDLDLAAGGNLGQQLAGGRVDDIESRPACGLTGLAFDKRAVDQALLLRQGCPLVEMLHRRLLVVIHCWRGIRPGGPSSGHRPPSARR